MWDKTRFNWRTCTGRWTCRGSSRCGSCGEAVGSRGAGKREGNYCRYRNGFSPGKTPTSGPPAAHNNTHTHQVEPPSWVQWMREPHEVPSVKPCTPTAQAVRQMTQGIPVVNPHGGSTLAANTSQRLLTSPTAQHLVGVLGLQSMLLNCTAHARHTMSMVIFAMGCTLCDAGVRAHVRRTRPWS